MSHDGNVVKAETCTVRFSRMIVANTKTHCYENIVYYVHENLANIQQSVKEKQQFSRKLPVFRIERHLKNSLKMRKNFVNIFECLG